MAAGMPLWMLLPGPEEAFREHYRKHAHLWKEVTNYISAIDMLRSIAAMTGTPGSESATNWLLQHGYALEEGGYVPGKGFSVP